MSTLEILFQLHSPDCETGVLRQTERSPLLVSSQNMDHEKELSLARYCTFKIFLEQQKNVYRKLKYLLTMYLLFSYHRIIGWKSQNGRGWKGPLWVI